MLMMNIMRSGWSFWWNAYSRWLHPSDYTSIYPRFPPASRNPSSPTCSSPPSWSSVNDYRWRASRDVGIGRLYASFFAKIIRDCRRGEDARTATGAVFFRLSIVDRFIHSAWITFQRTLPSCSVSWIHCWGCWLPIREDLDLFWHVCAGKDRTPIWSRCRGQERIVQQV